MVKSWLITGGCGFIGTSLIADILNKHPDSNIRIFDNLSVGTRQDLSRVTDFKEVTTVQSAVDGVELIVGDIIDYDNINRASKDIDCIVHLAANTGVGPSVEDPRADMQTNVIGLFNLLEAARDNKVNQFIFASSGAPAGIVDPPIHEEIAPHPVSPYGASKLAGEGYCSAYFHSFGINTIALRFGNVYGPGSTHKASVVAKFIKQALAGEICEIYGSGNQTRDFIYIDDLTEAIIKASVFERGGEVFQIASSKERTVNEVVEILRLELHKHSNIDLKVINADQRVGDVERNYSDTSKAQKLLGWKARTNIEAGLNQTISWFLDSN